MKSCVKAMDKSSPGFMYLTSKPQSLRDAKIKKGVFAGPKIQRLLKDENFELALYWEEKTAWEASNLVAKGFLENREDEKYEGLVGNLNRAYKNIRCNLSLKKINFLDSNVDFSLANCGSVSDEHGEMTN